MSWMRGKRKKTVEEPVPEPEEEECATVFTGNSHSVLGVKGNAPGVKKNTLEEEEAEPEEEATVFCQMRPVCPGCRITLTDRMDSRHVFTTEMEEVVTIGRMKPQNDLCIDYDKAVSKRHCMLLRHGNEFYIKDLDSSNGTFLNGSRIYGEGTPVEDGDIIRMGRLEFRIGIEVEN